MCDIRKKNLPYFACALYPARALDEHQFGVNIFFTK